MRRVEFIVLHCTAGPQTQTLESIQRHWRNLGWRRPGYHQLVAANGTVHILANFNEITNGVAGNNSNSIHIAYTGGVDGAGRIVDNRTLEQREVLRQLVEQAHDQYPAAVIQGHRDFSPDKNRNGIIDPHEWIKACPSFSVKGWLQEIGFRSRLTRQTRTTISRLNLRSGPGTIHPVITTLERGTQLQFLGEGNGWTYIQHQNQLGWVASQFLTP